MSYSFNVRAATKGEAKKLVLAELENVLKSQPAHDRDFDSAVVVADLLIELLPDDVAKDVVVSMHGSVSGHWENSKLATLTGVNVSVSAALAIKEA